MTDQLEIDGRVYLRCSPQESLEIRMAETREEIRRLAREVALFGRLIERDVGCRMPETTHGYVTALKPWVTDLIRSTNRLVELEAELIALADKERFARRKAATRG